MPRYVVERVFEGVFDLGPDPAARRVDILDGNADHSVTWLHSYVSLDGHRSFCIYDAPSPEAVRKAARRNSLPIERITQVLVLDPYDYR